MNGYLGAFVEMIKIIDYLRCKKIKTDKDPATPDGIWKLIGNEFVMICDARIKLSNIKNYGFTIEGNYHRKEEGNKLYILDNKKLYITTYQNDNFVFYKEDIGNNLEEVLDAIDKYYSEKGGCERV